MTTKRTWLASCLGAALLLPIGCASHEYGGYPNLYTDDDEKLVQATLLVSDRRDRGAIPHLIRNLNHDDGFVRINTHIALGVLTDNTRPVAYQWDWPDSERIRAQIEWTQWYEDIGKERFPPGPPPEAPEGASSADPGKMSPDPKE